LTPLYLAFPVLHYPSLFSFFFSNAPAPTQIYTLSLHDALPISQSRMPAARRKMRLSSPLSLTRRERERSFFTMTWTLLAMTPKRSEEHTSELQSQSNLVCRLLLEKKKKKKKTQKKKQNKKYKKYSIKTRKKNRYNISDTQLI